MLLAAACTLSVAALPGLASAKSRHRSPRHDGSHHTHRTHHRRARARHHHRSFVRAVRIVPAHHHVTATRAHTGGSVQTASTHPPTCAGAHVRIARARRGQVRRSVNCLVNVQRRDRGLPALRGNGRLNTSAQRWTNVMVEDRAFSHGADFANRISAVGFDWTHVGENIATGFRTPAGVVRAWMASTGHCQNILNPLFREDGTGVDLGEAMPHDRGTWTMDFGLLARQPAASDNWAPAEGCPYVGAGT